MKFINSRIEKNEIIMFYRSEDGKDIIEKRHPYHMLPPLTDKRKYKNYPPGSVSTSETYEDIHKKPFNYQIYFNDLDI